MGICMGARRTAIGEWLLLAVLLLAGAWVLWTELRPPRERGPATPAHGIEIRAEFLPGATTLAGVRLAGALALASANPGLGGLSGLSALPDGRLLLVSDAGRWLVLRPLVQGGRLAGVADALIGDLPAAGSGEKYDMDSEAVQVMPDGGLLVSFEQQHRLVRYDGVPPRRVVRVGWHTPAMRWLPNGGGEALALLPGGAMLWLPEHAQGGVHRGLLIAGGGARPVQLAGLPGMAITDAVALDAGRVLLLHRRFTGIRTSAALSLVDVRALAGGMGKARPLLHWDNDGPWPIDNMEGMALVRETGRPMLYLVSDNNFSAAQRTLLLRLDITALAAADLAVSGRSP